jgi:hypothetical protein
MLLYYGPRNNPTDREGLADTPALPSYVVDNIYGVSRPLAPLAPPDIFGAFFDPGANMPAVGHDGEVG